MAKTAKMRFPKFPKNAFKAPGFVKDLITNKYVLYLVAFLALTNVLGYMMLGKNVCVLLFILIAYLTTYFTNNMVFVLAVPLFLVGFFAICDATNSTQEGLEGMMEGALVESKDGSLQGVVVSADDDIITISYKDEDDKDVEIEVPVDTEDWIIVTDDDDGDDGDDCDDGDDIKIDIKNDKKKTGKTSKDTDTDTSAFTTKGKKQDYVDSAATLDVAYSNLQSMLGEGGIKGLTEETQSLVKNQTQLAEAMKGMGPLLDQAQGMLKTMNLGDLGKDIGRMTSQLKGASKDGFTSKISALAGAPF